MNCFYQKYNANTFKFTLNKSGSFPKFQIEIFMDNKCFYKSREIIISKHVIEEIIGVFKNVNHNLEISRFEFRDPDRSFLTLINNYTTVLGQTYNLVSGKREEFVVKDINKTEFLAYLERVNA